MSDFHWTELFQSRMFVAGRDLAGWYLVLWKKSNTIINWAAALGNTDLFWGIKFCGLDSFQKKLKLL